jgi:phosphotriesterase-related protein
MKTVETLAGPVDTANLGTTLMHEHIFALTPDIQTAYPGFRGWIPEIEIPKAREAIRQVRAAGIDTLVDATPMGLGRDIKAMEQAVSGTGLQVIASTGLYVLRDLPGPFRMEGPGSQAGGPEFIDGLLLKDINEGIEGTSIKAGVIKAASDADGLTPDVERALRVCARVSRDTGIPIMTHTSSVIQGGLDQQRVFREEGVDLNRVVIGHSGCGCNNELEYIERLIDGGSFVELDRFGSNLLPPPMEARIETLAALCARGYADRIVLSHDACFFIDWFPDPELWDFWQNSTVDRFLVITNIVEPAIKERGVTQEQIDQMRIHNPRRFFEGE